MFCTHCGSQIDENMKFCTNCGQPVEVDTTGTTQSNNEANATQGEWNSTPDTQAVNEQDTAQQIYQQANTQETNQQGSYQQANTQQTNQQGSYQQNTTQQNYQQPNYQQNNVQKNNAEYKLFLQIFAGVFGVIFAIQFISGIVGGLGTIFSMFGIFRYFNAFAGLITCISGLLVLVQAVVSAASSAVLVLTALKGEKENGTSFFTTFAVIRIVSILLVVISGIIDFSKGIAMGYPAFAWIIAIVVSIFFNVIVVGGFYGILYLMGVNPIQGLNAQNFQDKVKASVNDVIATAKTLQNNQNANTGNTTYTANNNANNNQADPYAYAQNPETYAQPTQQATYQQNNAYTQQTAMPSGAAMMNNGPLRTDRNLVIYILLSLVTCGIYGFYFIYKMAQDVNVACDGDGESTPGLLIFFVLTYLTCGIYAYYWYYKIANRLATNAPRYGLQFQENGTTVLMWVIFGMLLCGVGSFVAFHILIKNTNLICAAYNRAHGYN